MREVVVDPITRDKLLTCGDVVTVKDTTGRVIGWFQPSYVPEDIRNRNDAEPRTYTTAEVFAYLKRLG
jgi:hypothetical protein